MIIFRQFVEILVDAVFIRQSVDSENINGNTVSYSDIFLEYKIGLEEIPIK